MTQRRKRGRQPISESDLIQYIATKTGLSTNLVNRVVEGGEPWPQSLAIQEYFASRGRSLEEALVDPVETLQGLDRLEVDPEILARHRQAVAASTGVPEEYVFSISEAMREFFSRQIRDIRRTKRREAKRRG